MERTKEMRTLAEMIERGIAKEENTIRHLGRSNEAMKEAMASDPDPMYAEAIQENLQSTAVHRQTIERLQEKLKEYRK